ncbi:TPA: hypothetical protein ACIBMG_004026, partial [Salmonella enterica subsp. enterica serovar Muenchen]
NTVEVKQALTVPLIFTGGNLYSGMETSDQQKNCSCLYSKLSKVDTHNPIPGGNSPESVLKNNNNHITIVMYNILI